jgi:hypothetical protein
LIKLFRIFVRHKDALRCAVQVVILPGFKAPNEACEAYKPKSKGQRYHIQQDAHGRFLSLKAFRVTAREDSDIAIAAIKGVTKPPIASGIARIL